MRNIAVLRALGGIGDVLTALPALAQLRAAHPRARISYIGLPAIEAVARRFAPLIDRFVAFPGFPGIPEIPFEARRLHDFIDAERGNPQFDLCVQMHGSGSVSNVFAALLGAKRTAGYFIPGLWCPNDADYSEFPDALSERDRWSALAERLDCPRVEVLAFPVEDVERWTLSELAPGLERKTYAVVHAGASDPARRWPAERFAAVADRLAASGLRIVLTGTANECVLVKSVAEAMRIPALDLCGLTTLGEAAALIERAALVVTNDTGTSHIAASLARPSVVVFTTTDPARWAPENRELHIAVGSGVPDIPAGQQARRGVPSCPSVDEVLAAVDAQLRVAA